MTDINPNEPAAATPSESLVEMQLEISTLLGETERAADKILDAAEDVLLKLDEKTPDELVELTRAACLQIIEACEFQDLAGQRLSKILTGLQGAISLVDMLASQMDMGAIQSQVGADATAAKKDPLRNGPALEGQAISQDDVDDMFKD